MGSSSKAKQEVADYYLSLHIGVCQEADAVTGLFYGEKLMWEGEQAEAGAFVVNKKSLFGGPKKEGGVYGSVLVLPGDENQVLPQAMTRRWGVEDPSQTPAYRGMMSLFFCGYTQEFDDDDPQETNPPRSIDASALVSCTADAPGTCEAIVESRVGVLPDDTTEHEIVSFSRPGGYGTIYAARLVYCTSEKKLPDGTPLSSGEVYPYLVVQDDGSAVCYNQSDCEAGWAHEGVSEQCPPRYCRPGWVDAGPDASPRCVYPDVSDVTTFSSPRKGFYWSSNTPYLRDIWVRVRVGSVRTPSGTTQTRRGSSTRCSQAHDSAWVSRKTSWTFRASRVARILSSTRVSGYLWSWPTRAKRMSF